MSYTTVERRPALRTTTYRAARVRLRSRRRRRRRSPLRIRRDPLKEEDEPFSVVLGEPVNAHLERTPGMPDVLDDDRMGQGYWFVARDGGSFAFGDAG